MSATKNNTTEIVKTPKFVDIESPYSAPTVAEIKRNIRYARAAVRDCLLRGETPYASHLFFTQTGILDDNIAKDRTLGINAGKYIIQKLGAMTVVYADLGISKGMEFGIALAEKDGRTIEFRSLGKSWESVFLVHENSHSQSALW